jgi:hypothetical protein
MSKTHEKIDALIMAATPPEWVKTAVLISRVFDDPGFGGLNSSAQDVAERLYILIDHGKLDVQGNMRRWRDSDVRQKATIQA